MRSNRLIIASFVFLMGLIILAPQAYILHRYYMAKGDTVTATYEKSESATNAKDTVAMPFYRFSRPIGPLVQGCFLPIPALAHKPNDKPQYAELQLKVMDKCDEFVILTNKPTAHLILSFIGLIIIFLGLNLFRLALRSKA